MSNAPNQGKAIDLPLSKEIDQLSKHITSSRNVIESSKVITVSVMVHGIVDGKGFYELIDLKADTIPGEELIAFFQAIADISYAKKLRLESSLNT